MVQLPGPFPSFFLLVIFCATVNGASSGLLWDQQFQTEVAGNAFSNTTWFVMSQQTITALDLSNGSTQWQLDLSSNPSLCPLSTYSEYCAFSYLAYNSYYGTLAVVVLQSGLFPSKVTALNGQTGKVVWQQGGPGGFQNVSGIAIGQNGELVLVSLSSQIEVLYGNTGEVFFTSPVDPSVTPYCGVDVNVQVDTYNTGIIVTTCGPYVFGWDPLTGDNLWSSTKQGTYLYGSNISPYSQVIATSSDSLIAFSITDFSTEWTWNVTTKAPYYPRSDAVFDLQNSNFVTLVDDGLSLVNFTLAGFTTDGNQEWLGPVVTYPPSGGYDAIPIWGPAGFYYWVPGLEQSSIWVFSENGNVAEQVQVDRFLQPLSADGSGVVYLIDSTLEYIAAVQTNPSS